MQIANTIQLPSSQVYEMIMQLKEIQNSSYIGMDPNSVYVIIHNLRRLERSYRDYEEIASIFYNQDKDVPDIMLSVELLPIDDVRVPQKYSENLDIFRRIYENN